MLDCVGYMCGGSQRSCFPPKMNIILWLVGIPNKDITSTGPWAILAKNDKKRRKKLINKYPANLEREYNPMVTLTLLQPNRKHYFEGLEETKSWNDKRNKTKERKNAPGLERNFQRKVMITVPKSIWYFPWFQLLTSHHVSNQFTIL